jgi:5-methylcytosine-specific restriction endonuclease McrA
MSVLVLDKRKKPLMPCTEKRARLLLQRGRARIHNYYPFTIRLIDKEATECEFQSLTVKIDPGSKYTGIALVRENDNKDVFVLNLFELQHRGNQIRDNLTKRKCHRRNRRSRLGYREARFLNRTRKKGWLPPSLQHRVDTTISVVNKLNRYAPISKISVESVKFDMQAIHNPTIKGDEYQQGTLAGYNVREYVLEKWHRTCAYCGKTDTPLQIEHIHPKSKGGSNRVGNLTLACASCNKKKDNLPIEVFLKDKPNILAKIKLQMTKPLNDAAAVNATRNAIVRELQQFDVYVETAIGSNTKFNRTQFAIPKTHALDAVCVGEINSVHDWNKPTLVIKAMGRGQYQRTRLDKYGGICAYLTRKKRHYGFQTGDMVVANVTKGKKMGLHKGRVSVNSVGNFAINNGKETIFGVKHVYCKLIQRGNGYGYSIRNRG